MPTDWQFAVFWEDSQHPEMLSLEQAQAVATEEFTDADWLPPAIRELIKASWVLDCWG